MKMKAEYYDNYIENVSYRITSITIDSSNKYVHYIKQHNDGDVQLYLQPTNRDDSDIVFERIEKKNIYLFEGDYFKTNGEDLEFCKYLKKKKLKLFYSSKAICHHLQNDDAKSLSNRYWRYRYYGDGFKKRNFNKTIKNLIKQLKKTIIWTLQDIINLRWKVVVVNFLVFYHFCKIDFKFMKKKLNKI